MSSSLILPGDNLEIEDISQYKTTIGPGIYKFPTREPKFIPTQPGILNHSTQSNKQLIYIESNSKRYIPHKNDLVIGIVVGSIGEFYKVQLQDFSTPVLLNFMSFANATKKNRPNLKNGQVVYGKVTVDSIEIENEIECIDEGCGVLDDSGYVFNVNLNFARELLYDANSIFLKLLANKCQFEIAIGINGKIWLKCGEGVKKEVKESENKEDEDDDMDIDSTNVKDLKYTLAAVEYLKKAQFVKQDELKQVLNVCFKNVEN
ncbi:unnamed protein product [Candida verbasci]|uniref:Ribosomal RNA-processing protein 40 n=1 Tax=Candida verbasci TaxID=1227364 RepID=A0A9W4XCX2_9ASCO|nr:unnamed protein product [Candida verbasci]